jgi:hypothetical protein
MSPSLHFFLEKFQTLYKPTHQLSLDEAVIPWRGRLRIRTYNPAKLTKYGLLLRVKALQAILEIQKFILAKAKKLQGTIVSVQEPYLDQNYHVYQDNIITL